MLPPQPIPNEVGGHARAADPKRPTIQPTRIAIERTHAGLTVVKMLPFRLGCESLCNNMFTFFSDKEGRKERIRVILFYCNS